MVHLLEMIGMALVTLTILSVSPVFANGLRMLAGNIPAWAKVEVMTADPDVVHEVCQQQNVPSDTACAFGGPTPHNPQRYVVMVNNDLSKAQQAELVAGLR